MKRSRGINVVRFHKQYTRAGGYEEEHRANLGGPTLFCCLQYSVVRKYVLKPGILTKTYKQFSFFYFTILLLLYFKQVFPNIIHIKRN